MATLNVNTFVGAFDGGARPNLFHMTITGFDLAPGGDNPQLLIKAASLPGVNIGVIEVPFRGRVIKVAGDRTFDEWTFTVINNNNFEIRAKIEEWMHRKLNAHSANAGEPDQKNYYGTIEIEQLMKNGSTAPNGKYKLVDCFPSAVSPIELSYDSTDTVEEFDVTIQYNYWTKAQSAIL